MANLEVVEAPEPAEGADAAPAAHGPKKIVLMGIIAGAAVAGAAVGLLLIAPRLGSHGHAGADAGVVVAAPKGHGQRSGTVIPIENIVVNPAGAEGSHFVMATVAVEVFDKKVEEQLRTSEFVLKDIVMSTISRETMDMLRDPGARDRIKANLDKAIGDYTGRPDAVTVYLPEFVVQ
jgi:flagellar basal body-associated protein FliL